MRSASTFSILTSQSTFPYLIGTHQRKTLFLIQGLFLPLTAKIMDKVDCRVHDEFLSGPVRPFYSFYLVLYHGFDELSLYLWYKFCSCLKLDFSYFHSVVLNRLKKRNDSYKQVTKRGPFPIFQKVSPKNTSGWRFNTASPPPESGRPPSKDEVPLCRSLGERRRSAYRRNQSPSSFSEAGW